MSWAKPYSLLIAISVVGAWALSVPSSNAEESHRVTRDLQALYLFEAGSGRVVQDRSGVQPGMDLKIDPPSAVRWGRGHLSIRGSARIHSGRPAKKLVDAVRRSNELTVEAWIKPANTSQNGPARMVTLSANPNQRNFTLGQERNRYEVRLRTTSTSSNGIPATPSRSGAARARLTHVLYTRDRTGSAKIFVNGSLQGSKRVSGSVSSWNPGYAFALGNEFTGDRPWLGELHLVAIYSRALTEKEIRQNYRAGPKQSAELVVNRSKTLFEEKVAGLLANHCLECHDASTRKGGLDLSRRKAAFAGGENGKPIVAGKSAESLLWRFVESDDMPADRAPLNAEEKKLLRQWIDSGADWSHEVIDPVVYLYDRHASENWIRRLTVDEYIETVRSAVGVDISKEARKLLPKDLRADGFSNTAYNLGVDLSHVEAYAQLAKLIVSRMDVLKFTVRFSKSKSLNTDATTRQIVKSVGEHLLRGNMDEREVTNYSGIATTVASAGGSFEEGMGLLIEAMLQSPRFLYRVEDQRGAGTMTVGGEELASRLSYIIWGGPPDQELLRAAADGELDEQDRVVAQVRRLLSHPRAIRQSKRFISEWLNLNRLANMRPDPKRFPTWSPELADDMREETLDFFEHVVWDQQRPLADLFNAQVTFATPRLAKHYGLSSQGDGVQQYDLTKVKGRGGLLTQGSVLTIGGDDASMVTRGLFVMHELLRGVVKDPPPGVNANPPTTGSGRTQRDIAESRIANSNCGGCHAKFEPLAFGLEKFDGIGAFSDKDSHGNTLREDGSILLPGEAKPVAYKSSAELMDLLASSGRVQESITWKVTQFAVGRPLGSADLTEMNKIHKAAREGGGTWAATINAIVMSDLVQTTKIREVE